MAGKVATAAAAANLPVPTARAGVLTLLSLATLLRRLCLPFPATAVGLLLALSSILASFGVSVPAARGTILRLLALSPALLVRRSGTTGAHPLVTAAPRRLRLTTQVAPTEAVTTVWVVTAASVGPNRRSAALAATATLTKVGVAARPRQLRVPYATLIAGVAVVRGAVVQLLVIVTAVRGRVAGGVWGGGCACRPQDGTHAGRAGAALLLLLQLRLP